jgi:hypothetical protein
LLIAILCALASLREIVYFFTGSSAMGKRALPLFGEPVDILLDNDFGIIYHY